MSKTKSTVALWIACLAILMAALAPSISHALRWSRASQAAHMEICASDAGVAPSATATATAHHATATSDAHDTPATHDMSMDDCPLCAIHADKLGLPPTVLPMLAGAVGAPGQPKLYYRSPRPLFAWAPPQSRAPPASS